MPSHCVRSTGYRFVSPRRAVRRGRASLRSGIAVARTRLRRDDGYGEAEGFSALRNILDQYSQPENRITHALLSALNEDRHLLGLFLRDLVKTKPPVDARKLSVLEQQYPGEAEPSEDDLEPRGIPDGWIF